MPKRQLLLLRHAKAVPPEPGLEDLARPLAPRGERAAQAMGRHLAEHGLLPDLVLCSPARRTRSTWEILARELKMQPELLLLRSLYDFGDGSALIEAIRAHGGAAKRLMVVGHNPAVESLALALAGGGDEALRREIAGKYPTGALAVFSFPPGDWHSLSEGDGRLEAFTRPRDLGPD
jgi:phosphohistidine phosphatase